MQLLNLMLHRRYCRLLGHGGQGPLDWVCTPFVRQVAGALHRFSGTLPAAGPGLLAGGLVGPGRGGHRWERRARAPGPSGPLGACPAAGRGAKRKCSARSPRTHAVGGSRADDGRRVLGAARRRQGRSGARELFVRQVGLFEAVEAHAASRALAAPAKVARPGAGPRRLLEPGVAAYLGR